MSAEQIQTDNLRLGQRQAVSTIVERVRAGHAENSHTAIVLPTRYGKTDVMRVSGMMLIPSFISRALILVPSNYLRSQVVDRRRWEESTSRYSLPSGPRGIAIAEATRPPDPPFPRGNPLFVSMNIQMADRHRNLLVQWVDHEQHQYGVPPLVFVDEAHTGSTENQWGRCVNELAEAGAFVVLLTATPFRTDKEHIPGFELEPVGVEDVIRRRQSAEDPNLWDVFEGRRRIYRLKAHHTTTFREAWATQDPPVLCDITRRPFDIEVEEIDPLTGEVKRERLLSKLPDKQSSKVLDVELRKPRIINQACEVLVRMLAVRQTEEPETAAMVFVGNDKQGDKEDNKHAQDVKKAIRRLSRNLKVEIATSSTQKADKTIERFVQQADIDVLIVKQMAGLGVDCERLKVCLDLSNVRTPNAFIQRVTRIATVWDRREISGEDWDIVTKADYITPDDIIGKRLYEHFIRDLGGGSTREDLEYVRTVGAGDRDAQVILPDEVVAKRIIAPEEVQDSKLQSVPGATLPFTDKLFAEFPVLTKHYTQPDAAKGLARMGVIDPLPASGPNGGQSPTTPPEPNASQAPIPSVLNLSDERAAVRKRIDDLSKKITVATLGRPYKRGDREWIDKLREVKTAYRKRLGIPWDEELDDVDLDLLEGMVSSMDMELQRRQR